MLDTLTWLELDVVIVVIVVVCALRNVASERRVAGFHPTLRLPLSRLNAIFLHSRRPVYAVQFEVKTAGVTHRFAVCVATPQRCHRCFAVAARETNAPRSRLKK